VHNFLGIGEPHKLTAPMPAPGEHVVGIDFQKDHMGEHHEWWGTATLYIDDKPATNKEIRTVTGHFALCGEGLCIGYDSGDSVSAADYSGRFDYTGGELKKVTFDVADDAYIDVEAHLAAAFARD
jgi:arylsulfatase